MQISFGLIQIYLAAANNNTGQARSVAIRNSSDVANHFGVAKRDSFCRQLGFTRAARNSVYTLYAISMSPGDLYDFTKCEK